MTSARVDRDRFGGSDLSASGTLTRSVRPTVSRNGLKSVRRFPGSVGFNRVDVDAAAFAVEANGPVHQREQRVVVPHADVFAGVPLRPTLTNQNIAGSNTFAAEFLHATSLGVGIAAVTS